MGSVLENGLYLPDEGERNAYDGLKGNWNTLDNLVETVTALSSTGLIRKPVDALPITDIQTNVIYMLKATKPNGDVYRIEYMYIDDHWDALGTSETTLDDYYTKTETDDLPAVKSGINATKVSNYDTHIADTDIHVSLANKQTWDGKQNALDTAQTAAVNSGVTGTKVTGYDTHVSDTDIHVTASDKTAWNSKQDGLSQTQLAAVNSGVNATKVTGYDSHIADTDVHVTTVDKATWNGKQDALTQTQLDNIATIPDKANSADLATVATSGSYTDLINAPTIPTVNNATLTIQKNGTDVATFTANASSNVTANLSIPVNTSDLNNDAGFLTQHNPIDDELSATSVNALQNKVVKSELDGKAPLVHTHSASDVTSGTFNIARIPNLDASKITSGTIDIARLPKGSLERLIKVANQAARYALTADDVQLGDTVQQLDTGVMYVVTDETKLDSADGYTEFTAGSASSVPWSGVTGKPADYPPASHSHGNITNDGKVGTDANKPLITGTGGAITAGAFGNQANTFCEGNDSRLSDARAPVAHTHSKSDITDLLNFNFIPSANNAYDLGSSSYQWKSVYANAYYLGTTAFGDIVTHNASEFLTSHQSLSDYVTLNSAQTISGIKTITGGNQGKMVFKNPNYTKGDVNESSVTVSRIYFGNSASYDGANAILSTDINTSGNSIVELGAINNTASNSNRTSLILTYDKSATRPRMLKSWGDFVPYKDSTYDLGSSSYQWKTLNGVNPGALSLPNINYTEGDPDVYNVGTDINNLTKNTTDPLHFSWTSPFDGWLAIMWYVNGINPPYNVLVTTGDARYSKFSQTWSASSARWYFATTFPVLKNVTYYFDIDFQNTTIGVVHHAYLLPCLGNV